jgi:ribonuclease HII
MVVMSAKSRSAILHPPSSLKGCTAFFENEVRARGYRLIAGVDEVGRGALAGPLLAGAVILSLEDIPEGLDDSKKLSPLRREVLAREIRFRAISYAVAAIAPDEIDRMNVGQATRLAMRQAIEQLIPSPDFLLIDAMHLDGFPIPQQGIIHGDALSVSIAAASIIAKVARDQLMRQYDAVYPGYGFAKNVGYGTLEHRTAISMLGPTPIHRLSFRGVTPRLFE